MKIVFLNIFFKLIRSIFIVTLQKINFVEKKKNYTKRIKN